MMTPRSPSLSGALVSITAAQRPVEGARDIDGPHPGELRYVSRGAVGSDERHEALDTCSVHIDVDCPESIHRRTDRGGHLVRVGDIGPQTQGCVADLASYFDLKNPDCRVRG
jgi:hypothetical protein